MDLSNLPCSVVQITYLTLSSRDDLRRKDTDFGKAWLRALQEISSSEEFSSLRWGRSVEEPEKVQLHITRPSHSAHLSYLASSNYQNFLEFVQPILHPKYNQPKIRHVKGLLTYTSTPTTPFHAPVTGTAVYLSTSSAWHEGAWPCWTHIVRHIKGCTGIAGGGVVESIKTEDASCFAGISAQNPESNQTYENVFIVYVGWESIKDHNNYHHTKHFQDHGIVLRIGNEGWREYGHIKFEGWVEKESARSRL